MKRAAISTTVALTLLASTASVATAHPRPPGPPESALQGRLGYFFLDDGDHDGDDDGFWKDTESVFTLDASDFEDFSLGFSYVHSVRNKLEVGFNVDIFEKTVRSEYRDFVDQGDLPILHDSSLSLIPMTVDLRFLPIGRYRVRPGGRHIVQPTFYLGAGAGLVFWDYEEVGDFLDFTFDPPVIFGDRFTDDGVALEVHGLAGVEIPVGPRINLLFEGRASFAEDKLGGDFSDLAERDIRLGGLAIYGGFSFRL